MDVDILPKEPKKVFGGDGGDYYAWSAADLPMLAVSDKGAAKLALRKQGLAMPSYSDSAKIAYVLEVLSSSALSKRCLEAGIAHKATI